MAARSDPDPSFARCLGLARAGHRSALGDLLEAARPQLIEAARASIGSRLRAKVRTSDLVQSALLEGLRSLDEFRGTSRSEFAGWLHRILENNVRDRERYHRAQRRTCERETTAADLMMPAPAASPSDAAAASELLVRTSEALGTLRPEHRRVLLLCMTRDLSHTELGRILGKSPGACRVLLSRARAQLLLALERTKTRAGRR